jgi:hypothetical protein
MVILLAVVTDAEPSLLTTAVSTFQADCFCAKVVHYAVVLRRWKQ